MDPDPYQLKNGIRFRQKKWLDAQLWPQGNLEV
jgi:hypothetical protein